MLCEGDEERNLFVVSADIRAVPAGARGAQK